MKSWFQKKANKTREALGRAFEKKKEEAREKVRLNTRLQDLKSIQKKIDKTYGMDSKNPKHTPSAGNGGDHDWSVNSSQTSWEKLAEARVFCATCRCECCKVVTGEDESLRGHCMFWWSDDLHAEVRREKETRKQAEATNTASQQSAANVTFQTDRGPKTVQGGIGLDTLNSGFEYGPPIPGPMLSQAPFDFGSPEMQAHPAVATASATATEEPLTDDLASSDEDLRTTPPDMRRFHDVRRGLSLAVKREVLEDSMAFE